MAETGTETPLLDEMKGSFVASLVRNNKKIKEDRAIQIAESAQIFYKRKVEDLDLQIKQKRRDRQAMLDLSPTTTDSLILASDFKADEFVAKDIALGVEIRELEIKRDIAQARYKELFT